MAENSSENVKEVVITDASGTEHEIKIVENSQGAQTLPRPCKGCGKEIQTGWNHIEGYCRDCWKAIRKGSRPLESFGKS